MYSAVYAIDSELFIYYVYAIFLIYLYLSRHLVRRD